MMIHRKGLVCAVLVGLLFVGACGKESLRKDRLAQIAEFPVVKSTDDLFEPGLVLNEYTKTPIEASNADPNSASLSIACETLDGVGVSYGILLGPTSEGDEAYEQVQLRVDKNDPYTFGGIQVRNVEQTIVVKLTVLNGTEQLALGERLFRELALGESLIARAHRSTGGYETYTTALLPVSENEKLRRNSVSRAAGELLGRCSNS